MIVLMYFSMGEMIGLPLPSYAAGMDGMFALALTELVLTIPIVLINRKYYINGFKTLLHRAPDDGRTDRGRLGRRRSSTVFMRSSVSAPHRRPRRRTASCMTFTLSRPA